LYLVGILFPHFNEDAQSKSNQIGIFQLKHIGLKCCRVFILHVS